jgi:methylated-DNA-[protein]-cysteine S-methyltransferase
MDRLTEKMTFIHSFDPIVDDNSRVLILGSMPGKHSLVKGEYYAHPRNLFWILVYSIFGAQPDQIYEEKESFLRSRKIALWDVIKECNRSGSSDSKIINPIINDFDQLLARYPDIRCIFLNGKKAESLFKRNVKNITKYNVSLFTLPSSSPANAGISLNKKIEAWSLIKELADK